MSDYIKREDAIFIALQQPFFQNSMATEIRQIKGIDLDDYVPREFHDKTCEAMAKMHQDEIADMVSVVRCKECVHHYENRCYRFDEGEYIVTYADDYCSYGERREP